MTVPRHAATLLPAVAHAGWLRARLEPRGTIVLDFDGTLTPIVERPERAVLSQAARTALAGVARRCAVAVLSGRALEDVRRRVGMPGLVYGGCHGLEIAGAGLRYEHEGARALWPLLADVAAQLGRMLASIPGVQIEDKRWTIAVHDRRVPWQHVAFVRRMVELACGPHPELRLIRGKRVTEIRPALDWDKGRALQWIVRALGRQGDFVAYLGDDRTDEDAFAAVAEHGAGILVGPASHPTAARFVLADPLEALVLLERLG